MEYKGDGYSVFTEWEATLLKGEPLRVVHAEFYAFLNCLEVHWVRQDKTLVWVEQEKETFLGILGRVTVNKVLLTHLSVGVGLAFVKHGKHVTPCQLCPHLTFEGCCF